MGAGDLTSSTPLFCETEAAIKTAIDALNITTATDFIKIIPCNNGWLVFKVERAAA